MRRYLSQFFLISGLFFGTVIFAQNPTQVRHGYSPWGNLSYNKDFKNFDYVNPNAPKGGTVTIGFLGSFDSLNPLIIEGTSAGLINMVCFARLMTEAYDNIAQSYGYLAVGLEVAEDNSWVDFILREDATFSNGDEITAADVLFSFQAIVKDGVPMYRYYYRDVGVPQVISKHRIRFPIKDPKNKEIPLILGQIPILSSKYYVNHKFNKSTLEPFPCSGPYYIAKVNAGSQLILRKVKKWWGEKVPACVGNYNFEEIICDYYRDSNTAFEAFKTHKVSFRIENSGRLWATGYDFPAFKDGKVKKVLLPNKIGAGTTGIFFNTRKPYLNLPVRQAISKMLHFNWLNKACFHNAYTPCNSYYCGTNLAFNKTLPQGYPADSDIPRSVIQESIDLFKKAGWVLDLVTGKMINEKTREKFPELKFILSTAGLQKIALHLQNNLLKIGLDIKVTVLDSSTYHTRLEKFDYDLVYETILQSLTPGNEQRDYFSSRSSDITGSKNFAGIKNQQVDELIEKIIGSASYEDLVGNVQALDKVLIENCYIILGWYLPYTRIACWQEVKMPNSKEIYGGPDIMSWWIDYKLNSYKTSSRE